jgi:hypothetical protein
MIFFIGRRFNRLFLLLTAIFVFYYFAFNNEKDIAQQVDFEQRVNEIKKSKDEKKNDLKINSSFFASETKDFLEKFLHEHFKEQLEILIQLKNIKK